MTPEDQLPQQTQPAPQMSLREYIDTAGDNIGVPKQLRDSIFQNESSFEHYGAGGAVKQGPMTKYGWRAIGVGQLSPDTAKKWGVDPRDPIQNAYGSLKEQKELYDKYLASNSDPKEAALLTAAAYNSGAHNVDKYHGIPPFAETQDYVAKVAKNLRQHPIQPSPVTGPSAAPSPSVATVQQPSAQQAEQSPLDRATTAIQQATPQDALQLAAQRHLQAVAQRQRQRQIQAKVAAARQAQKGPMGITSGAGGSQEGIMPQIGGAPSLAKILPRSAGTSTPISPLRQQAARNVRNLTFDPAANVKSLIRAATGNEQADIDEEEQRLKESQVLQQTPEMIAAQKRIGSVPAEVPFNPAMPSPRGAVSAIQRFGGGIVKEIGGVFDAIGDANLGGLGPATKPVAGQIRDYLNKRGEILQQSASLPLNEQDQAIERQLPEKATDAVTGLGLSVAQLVLLKKATGMSLGSIMATESYLQNSDKPLSERIPTTAESYAMGRILDTHLSRPASAVAFGGPTAVQSGLAVAQGNKSLEDALLETGVQAGAGAILGGKAPEAVEPTQTVSDALQGQIRGGEIDRALAARESNVKPTTHAIDVPAMRVVDTVAGAQPVELPPNATYPATKYPENLGVVGPTKPVEAAPKEGVKLNRWIDPRAGAVTESTNQARVKPGQVRVIDAAGKERIVQRPTDITPSEQQARDQAEEAAANVPFKVIDRRGARGAQDEALRTNQETVASGRQAGVQTNDATPAQADQTARAQNAATGEPVTTESGNAEQQLRHVDLQSRRTRNTESGNKGQFKPESKAETEQRRAQVNQPSPQPTTPGVTAPVESAGQPIESQPLEAAQPVRAETTASTPTERVAFLTQKLSDMGAADATIANTPAERLAAINDTRKELERAKAEGVSVSEAEKETVGANDIADRSLSSIQNESLSTIPVAQSGTPTASKESITQSPPEAPQVKPPESPKPIELQPEGSKERGHVATVEAKGFEVSDDGRNYDPRTNAADVATAQGIIDKEGPDAALERLRSGKHDIPSAALGHTLMVHLRGEAQVAEKAGDNETAAEKWAKTAEATGYTVSSLTPHAQEVQAASIINRLSPEGILTEATRIVKANNPKATLTPELTKRFSDLGVERTDYDSLASKIEELQRATRKTGTRTSPSKPRTRVTVTPSDILAKLEAGAKERLAAQGIRLSAGLDPEQFRDRSIIGAVKIAKGIRAISQWQAEMIKDFGEDIKPHLQDIRNEALRQFKDAKQEAKDQSDLRQAAKLAGMKPEEMTAEDLSKSQRYLDLIKAKKQIVSSELRHEMMKLEDDQRPKWQRQLAELNRAGMVGIRSFEKILGALTFKSAKDMIARFPEAAMDATRVFIKGGDTPRRATLPSPTGEVGLGTQTVKTAGRQVGNFVAAMRGKESAVMLAHTSAFENPYVAGALTGSTRLLAGKEAILRTYHEESAKAEMANLLVKNDIADKQIEDNKDAIRDRLSMYRHESPTIDGPRNLKLIHDWANEVAKYEQRSGRIPAGGNKEKARTYVQARASELEQNVGTLLALKAQKQADFAVGAGPSRLQSALNSVERGARQIDTKFGGPPVAETSVKIARGVFLPFIVRPANSIGQHVADYLGLRAVPSLVGAINEKFDGPQTAVFQKTLSRGLTTHAFVAMAAMLAAKGLLDRDGNLHAGGKIYHTNEIPFLGWDMALGAGFHYGWQESKQKGKDPMIGAGKGALRATGNALAHHPLLRSAGDLADDFDDWRKSGAASEKVQKFAGQVGARFVPWPVQLAADVSDTKQREVKGPIAPVMNVVPGLRQELPVRMNKLTKTPVEKSRLHAFDPTRSESEEENLAREKQRQKQEERMTLKEGILQRSNPHVSDEMKRLKTEGFSGEIKTPKDEIKVGKEKRQLTNDQWEGYTKDFQQEFYTKAEPIIASERYQKMDDDTKRKVLSRLRAVAHEIAKRNVIQTK